MMKRLPLATTKKIGKIEQVEARAGGYLTHVGDQTSERNGQNIEKHSYGLK